MRGLAPILDEALRTERQMVFVAGPRQVGKTTLARALLEQAGSSELYFNWDIDAHRRALVRDPSGFFRAALPPGRAPRPRIVLDEIHKYPRWKRFLKGFFDEHGGDLEILVTGSGRLDVYQRGGDSLLGRYHLHHLHPFTVGERLGLPVPTPDRFVSDVVHDPPPSDAAKALEELERFSGFPEPLFAGRDEKYRRWRRAYERLVIREDLRDLTRIRELGLIESLVTLLPERIGSPLSLNALSIDLGVAFNTVKLWMEWLSRLYFLIELRPFAGKLARTLRREAKVYLFDPTPIADPGAKFENLVALHLAKLCDFWTDQGYGDFALRYVRDKEKREVDFLITEGRRPWLLVESKLGDGQISPALRYFVDRLRPVHGGVQLVRNLGKPFADKPALHSVPATWALARM